LKVTVKERADAARTVTPRAKPAGPHPIGTPRATNTGALAAAAWLASLGVIPDHARWFVEIELGRDSRFVLEVYAEEWGFQVHHLEQTSWIRVTDIAFAHGHDDHRLLKCVPRLREIGLFVRQLERRFGVDFDRTSVRVRSSIPNAEPALRAWVAAL
jgi:hypothetical protein